MMMISLQTRSDGFTVLEMIVIVIIIGILSGLALPPISRQWQDERLKAGATTMATWIDDQRKRAIQNSSPCDLSLNLGNASISSTCDYEATTQTLNLRDEVSDIDTIVLSITEGLNNWTFTPRGTAYGTTDLEVQLTFPGTSDLGHCIRLTAPLALVRSARLNSERICDYTTTY